MARIVGIDPSTHTGFVALDMAGNVIRATELTGIGDKDPKRMSSLIGEVMDFVRPDDKVCIEGFGFASQQAVQNGGIGWGIRVALYRRGIPYTEAAPDQLKKFLNVSRWKGEKGKKERMTDKEKKAVVMAAIRERYSFFHPNHNVNDAFVLAKIMEAIHDVQEGRALESYRPEEAEVIQSILSPKEKKPRLRRKKVAK